MRKALLTFFGASLVGALFIPSCVIKSDSDDDDSSSSTGGTATLGTGTSTGAGADSGGAGGDGGSTATSSTADEACADLEITNSDTNETCGSTEIAAQYRDINMLIVLDKSGSMDTTPTGFGDTKWAATKTAISAALAASTEQVRYGLLMYPDAAVPADCVASGNCCDLEAGAAAVNVDVAAAADSVELITDTLADTTPGGGTPTAAALEAAYVYYTDGVGSTLTGDKYVLLATDGGPNCNAEHAACDRSACTTSLDASSGMCTDEATNCCEDQYTDEGAGPIGCVDDQSVLDQIQALADVGIKTFVVGIPGTELYSSYLTQFAEAGGATDPNNPTLKYFEVTADMGVDGLTDTFKGITETLVRDCDITLKAEPTNAEKLNVAIECELLTQQNVDGEVNWSYNGDPENPVITIQGDWCNVIETQGVTRVDVIEGCTTITLT